MPLTGTHSRNIDEKRRLALPKPLRDDLRLGEPPELFVAPGMDRCVVLYSPTGFDELARRLASSGASATYMRLFYSSAERMELDHQSRFRVPERLLEHAGIAQRVCLLGVMDHVEIWDEQIWLAYQRDHGPEFDRLARDAMQTPPPSSAT